MSGALFILPNVLLSSQGLPLQTHWTAASYLKYKKIYKYLLKSRFSAPPTYLPSNNKKSQPFPTLKMFLGQRNYTKTLLQISHLSLCKLPVNLPSIANKS